VPDVKADEERPVVFGVLALVAVAVSSSAVAAAR
jgi:hypothetical protein